MRLIERVQHRHGKELQSMLEFYGVRSLLDALVHLCDGRAEVNVELYNAVQAKQWAAWSLALEALRDNHKLTDPGRE